MAQIVNLRQTEYKDITTELSKMHIEQLMCIEDVISKLRIIANNKSFFSASQTSKKMVDMLDVITSDVISLLKQIFNDSDKGINNMINSIMTTDSIYG